MSKKDDFPPIYDPRNDKSRRQERDNFPPILEMGGPKGKEILSREKEIRQRIADDMKGKEGQ